MAEGIDFSEALINEVRTCPWLYDIRRADYKDNIKKNNSWTEISKKLNVEESLVKKRWQNIRDQYRRKNKEENLPSGSGGRKRQQWAYFNMLSFLRPGIEQINTISNFVEEKESSQNHINLGEANTGNNSGLF
ncbi:transcription factor Adf-1-like [Centruroides sculpturatus]|uniref:transcription factor Adf-1-like n=1 Tax=Centruroides sculpturatus TaxID=218467 RepID=UPI000C6E1523|nr:transcription factor Adf-1-like [Centruroides sculpturatus]